MNDFLDVIAGARRAKDYGRIVELVPYATFLGMDFSEGPAGLLYRLAFRQANIGNPSRPALHGGVIGAFMEHAAILQVLWNLESEVLPKVIDFSLDFLRPGRPETAYARCNVWRQGQRVVNVAVEAWQTEPDSPIATARTHLLLTRPGQKSGGSKL